jgi:hypothetical protein
MINRPALAALGLFNQDPTTFNASLLVCIPTLYDVLKYEEQLNGLAYSAMLLGVCKWLHERASTVLQKLIVHGVPPVYSVTYETDWRKVRSISM